MSPELQILSELHQMVSGLGAEVRSLREEVAGMRQQVDDLAKSLAGTILPTLPIPIPADEPPLAIYRDPEDEAKVRAAFLSETAIRSVRKE